MIAQVIYALVVAQDFDGLPDSLSCAAPVSRAIVTVEESMPLFLTEQAFTRTYYIHLPYIVHRAPLLLHLIQRRAKLPPPPRTFPAPSSYGSLHPQLQTLHLIIFSTLIFTFL